MLRIPLPSPLADTDGRAPSWDISIFSLGKCTYAKGTHFAPHSLPSLLLPGKQRAWLLACSEAEEAPSSAGTLPCCLSLELQLELYRTFTVLLPLWLSTEFITLVVNSLFFRNPLCPFEPLPPYKPNTMFL